MRNKSITLNRPWEKLTEEFIRNLNKRETTKHAYKEALRNWVDFIGAENLTLSVEDIETYKTRLVDRKYSPYTINLYLTALKIFFDYLVRIDHIQSNPAEKIERKQRPKSRRDCLTEDEFFKLLQLEQLRADSDLRDRAILVLKMCTGLRDISLVLADVGDIQVKSGEPVLYYQGKGRDTKDEFVILTKRPFEAINEYLSRRPAAKPADPLFVSTSKRNFNQRVTTKTMGRVVKKFYKWANIIRPGIKPHSLRHTAVTFSLLGGADITQVKDMAGHKSIETTIGYRHNLERMTDPAEMYVERYIDKNLKSKSKQS